MLRIHWTFLLIVGAITHGTDATPIHSWLVDCFRGNETSPLYPNTLQALIEIIRKLENADQTLTDIRVLSALILHQLRLDGIERLVGAQESPTVIPFGVSGLQYPKLKLILQMVSNVASNLDIMKILDRKDRCHLHRMMSSAIDSWRRNDEHQTCLFGRSSGDQQPGSPKHPFLPSHNSSSSVGRPLQPISRCPIEKGAVRTNGYGPIAPGIVIASIAAGLQPQDVSADETPWSHYHQKLSKLETLQRRNALRNRLEKTLNRIDNVYAASLAVNLAEICMNQGDVVSNVPINVKGHWNDTYLPRIRYLEHPFLLTRELTDSEVLAGVDGLFLAQEIPKLRIHGNRLRLSQALDEYYSSRGLPFVIVENLDNNEHRESPTVPAIGSADPDHFGGSSSNRGPFNRHGITNACHRMTILRHMKRNKLKQEIFQIAQVLRLSTSSLMYDDVALSNSCNATVDLFFKSTANLLNQLPKCEQLPAHLIHPHVDMVLITDNSRNDYENTKLIVSMAEAIDVSEYGSILSIIDGSRSSLLTRHSSSLMDISQVLKETFANPSTASYSLSSALAIMLQMLTQRTDYEQQNHIIAGLPQVAIIFIQGAHIAEMDFANAQNIIAHSLRSHPDLNYLFVSNDEQLVHDLFKAVYVEDPTHRPNYHIIQESSIEIERFDTDLKTWLMQLPRRIFGSNCQDMHRDYNEAYVTPHEDIIYRVHPYYLTGGDRVKIQFDGVSHGTFTVCMANNANFEQSECKTTSDHQTAKFDVITCEDQNACDTVYFKISVEQSLVKCIELGCRHQDQIRYYIRQQGLGCTSAASNLLPHLHERISIIFICILVYLASRH